MDLMIGQVDVFDNVIGLVRKEQAFANFIQNYVKESVVSNGWQICDNLLVITIHICFRYHGAATKWWIIHDPVYKEKKKV